MLECHRPGWACHHKGRRFLFTGAPHRAGDAVPGQHTEKVRKNKDDKTSGKEFYFLGGIESTGEYEQIAMAETGDSAVEIGYKLDVPVEQSLYHYLTTDLGEA